MTKLHFVCLQANEKAAIYKNKVIHNWNEICTIYSKDHATGQGARTGAEAATDTEAVQTSPEANETSTEVASPSTKRPLIRLKRIYFPEHFCYGFSSNLCVLNTTNTD
jgi:hypothetical protein